MGKRFRSRSTKLLIVGLLACCGACRREPVAPNEPSREKPQLVLWAWDRAEDLRFLKPGEAEVAALVGTMQMSNGRLVGGGRQFPLLVNPDTLVTAVVRLELHGSELPEVEDTRRMIQALLFRQAATVQIDFDAVASQREWYEKLLRHLATESKALRPERSKDWVHPAFKRVSITALASWCVDPPWFRDQRKTIDEVVPMLYAMGDGRVGVLQRLARQKQFAEGCRGALGIAMDEPLPWYPPARRVYVFSPVAWTKEAFDKVCARWQ